MRQWAVVPLVVAVEGDLAVVVVPPVVEVSPVATAAVLPVVAEVVEAERPAMVAEQSKQGGMRIGSNSSAILIKKELAGKPHSVLPPQRVPHGAKRHTSTHYWAAASASERRRNQGPYHNHSR